MHKAFLSVATVLFGLAALPAGAMPLATLSDGAPGITLAAQGCGVGWYRGPYGHCHPGAPVYGAPVYAAPVYAPRHCWRGYYGRLHCN